MTSEEAQTTLEEYTSDSADDDGTAPSPTPTDADRRLAEQNAEAIAALTEVVESLNETLTEAGTQADQHPPCTDWGIH